MERRNSDHVRHALCEIARHDGGSRLAGGDLSDHDVRELVDLAERHRVSGLTLRVLAERRDLPADVEERRQHRRDAGAAARLTTMQTIGRLLEHLDMPFLVVKGPAIAAQWYEHPGDREFGDLDVLVARNRFRRAVERLEAAGATPLLSNWSGFAAAEVAEVPLQFDETQIDLHWDLVGVGTARRHVQFDSTALFDRSIPIGIGPYEIRTLDPTDALVHVCVNAGLDGARRLANIVDVDRMVRSGIDTDLLIERATAAGARALCAAVLERSSVVLGTHLPDGLLDALEPWRGWLATTRLSRRLPRTPASLARGGVESGLVTAAGRDRRSQTVTSLVRHVGSALAERSGRGSKTREGGSLDWNRASDPGSRERYFEWVDAPAPATRRRVRSAAVFEAALAAHEPRTTPLIGAARSPDLYGAGCRADLWTSADGAVGGALAWNRWSIGRTTGYVVIFDPSIAPDMARRIDRLGITDLAGFDGDVEPLRRHLDRWRFADPATAATLPAGFVWGDSDGPTRIATKDDLDEVSELLWRHAPHGFQNRWLLRQRASRAIDELTLVVLGADGAVIGAGVRQSSTRAYHCWDFGVVEPSHREHGYSWHLVAAGAGVAHAAGVGGLLFAVDSNPMPMPDDVKVDETYYFVQLRTPRRFKGEVRLRRVIDRILTWNTDTIDYREVAHRSPGAGDDRVTTTRTQAWWNARINPGRD